MYTRKFELGSSGKISDLLFSKNNNKNQSHMYYQGFIKNGHKGIGC